MNYRDELRYFFAENKLLYLFIWETMVNYLQIAHELTVPINNI